MAVSFYPVILILLSLAASCFSDPVQDPETVFKRQTGGNGGQEETPIETRVDQLYQIYQATQNNMIQLNTEISLFNEQLANMRDMVKILMIGVSSDVVRLVSDVGTLKNNEKEMKANSSQLAESVSTQLSSVREAMDVMNNDTCIKIEEVQSSVNKDRDTTMAQLSSLQSSVDTLKSNRDTTMTQLSSLQSSVNTLTTRVNSPVNLYKNCRVHTQTCTIDPAVYPRYWARCSTQPGLPKNVIVRM